MKLVTDYAFSPGPPGEGTIEIAGVYPLEKFYKIVNSIRGSVIFSAEGDDTGGSVQFVEGNTFLTLLQNTSNCDSQDSLQIQLFDTVGSGESPLVQEVCGPDGGRVPVTSSVPVRTPTTSSIASSDSSVTILALNSNRKGFSISNISTSKLYLSFTSPATTTNCFIEVPSGAFLLLDQQLIVGNAIYGIWASANGTAQVTDYV